MFFGALLSAIMSCSAATLLAPSVTFAENILRPLMPNLADWQFLRLLRIVVLLFAGAVLIFALTSNASIYGMVENAYKVTLAAAFTPLAFGLYWKRRRHRAPRLPCSAVWVRGWVWNSRTPKVSCRRSSQDCSRAWQGW